MATAIAKFSLWKQRQHETMLAFYAADDIDCTWFHQLPFCLNGRHSDITFSLGFFSSYLLMFIQCSGWITLLIFRSLGVGLLLGCYRLAFVICSMLLPCGVKLQSNREKCGRLKCGLFWLIVVNVGIRLVTGSVLPHTSAIDSISARQLLIQSTPIHSITQFERIPPRIPWRIPQLMLWIYYC